MTSTKLAVIPARGGSTRLVGKNIFPLGGKPLIRWSVEAVVESGCFDKVLVSTDSDEIFESVCDLPVERHYRPAAHATERATVLKAMIDLMRDSEKYDVFSYFLPTCPFVSPRDIKRGVELLTKDVDSVISFTEYSETIQLACIKKQDAIIPVYDNLTSGLTNSKFIQKYYRPTGAFHISWWDNLLERENFFVGNVRGVEMPRELAIDINDRADMMWAEFLLRERANAGY